MNPGHDVFSDAPRSKDTFQIAAFNDSSKAHAQSRQQVPKRLTVPLGFEDKHGSKKERAFPRRGRDSLTVQRPLLAQSDNEPTLDDLQLYDTDKFPIPMEPGQVPGGAFDFSAPSTNPFKPEADTQDAPGDFVVPESFPDAPEPTVVIPETAPATSRLADPQ